MDGDCKGAGEVNFHASSSSGPLSGVESAGSGLFSLGNIEKRSDSNAVGSFVGFNTGPFMVLISDTRLREDVAFLVSS
jgi:hypothetical protein